MSPRPDVELCRTDSQAACPETPGPDSPSPHRADGRLAFGWGTASSLDAVIEDSVLCAVEQTRRAFHVHSERVYLAGVAEGAAVAYRLGLTMPDRIAGVVALNGRMPKPAGQ